MTSVEFNAQMQRLVNTFGKSAYPNERARLIWREVQDISAAWFEQVVDGFIGNSRQPPLVPDFASQIAVERERLWRIQKEENEKSAKNFWACMDESDRGTIFATIRRRITGQLSDLDWAKFQLLLEDVANSSSRGVE